MTSTFLRSMLVAGAAVAALSVAACNKPAAPDNAANNAADSAPAVAADNNAMAPAANAMAPAANK